MQQVMSELHIGVHIGLEGEMDAGGQDESLRDEERAQEYMGLEIEMDADQFLTNIRGQMVRNMQAQSRQGEGFAQSGMSGPWNGESCVLDEDQWEWLLHTGRVIAHVEGHEYLRGLMPRVVSSTHGDGTFEEVPGQIAESGAQGA